MTSSAPWEAVASARMSPLAMVSAIQYPRPMLRYQVQPTISSEPTSRVSMHGPATCKRPPTCALRLGRVPMDSSQ